MSAMQLLAQYGDDDDEEEPTTIAPPPPKLAPPPRGAMSKALAKPGGAILPFVDAAPDVNLLGTDEATKFAIAPSSKKLLTNPTFAALNKPLIGPVPVGEVSLEQKFTSHKLGHVEKCNMNSLSFDQQYLSFHNYGYAANPQRTPAAGQEVLESTQAVAQVGRTIWDKPKRRRMTYEEHVEVAAGGPEPAADQPTPADADKWGGFADSDDVRRKVEEEVQLREEEVARQKEEERAIEGEDRETKERVTSVFHGARETDYAGRSWIENKVQPPKDIDERHCYLPKKWIHTWSGHTMGVQQIRWFPNTAHLLLSAGMDGKIKIWDYHNQRKCLRDYMGHDQAVRDINFTNDGRRFYSVSFDKNIQYWDTETGQIIATFTNKKTPYCVAVHPDPAQQNVILTGCSSKKAVQWDANTASIVQEYDEHLGAVNTVTFCEEGKRILTSSDDKKIFLWEFGIPVVVKHIAEPTMHSVPSIVMSPNKKFLIGQSMDNKIITYEAFGRFKFQGKRQFKGHLNAGYAITPGFSTDGHWVMSGDADGKLWFWDWHKMKNFRVLKAHDGVCSSCLWHPGSTSRVVTCGWDGAIKLWD